MKDCRVALVSLVLCLIGLGYGQEARNSQVRAMELKLLQAKPLPLEDVHPISLIVTYCSRERRRGTAQFDILIDGQKIADQNVGRQDPLRFYEVEYPIPVAQVKGKKKVTVKFQAQAGSTVAGVYGIRMIKADAQR